MHAMLGVSKSGFYVSESHFRVVTVVNLKKKPRDEKYVLGLHYNAVTVLAVVCKTLLYEFLFCKIYFFAFNIGSPKSQPIAFPIHVYIKLSTKEA